MHTREQKSLANIFYSSKRVTRNCIEQFILWTLLLSELESWCFRSSRRCWKSFLSLFASPSIVFGVLSIPRMVQCDLLAMTNFHSLDLSSCLWKIDWIRLAEINSTTKLCSLLFLHLSLLLLTFLVAFEVNYCSIEHMEAPIAFASLH